ncbi:MAG: hypothetical protein ABI844_07320, partial [Saprospiraceae bacterium]
FGIKTFLLTTNYNYEGLLKIISKDKTKSRLELGSDEKGSGFLKLFNPQGLKSAELNNDSISLGGKLSVFNKDSKVAANLASQLNGSGILQLSNNKNNVVESGGDSIGNGYLNLFNNKGLNTFFMGHNEFNDGKILLKNNLGNVGASFTAYGDGGSVIVTDGKPGINHRIAMDAGLNGGKLSIYNKEIKLVGDLSVGDNGEGQWRIPGKQDLTKSRLILGGDNNGAGYMKFYNSSAIRFLETGALGDGAGYLSTYNKTGKQLTNISPSGNAGGAFTIMNDNENIVGVLAYDGAGGTVYVSNKDRVGGSWLSTNNLGGSLFIRNNSGKQNGELITTTAGGDLNLFNSTGINTARLGQFANGSGILEIGTPAGDKVARITASDGTGYIGLDNINKLEVVRITANLGKGGGMGLRNEKGFDMINLTQDQSYGAILVNNATGGLLNNITHNTFGGGFIGNRDQNGKDAVWMTSSEKGGGYLTTFNTLGKMATVLSTDVSNNGVIQVNASAGNEIARIETNSVGAGRISIKSSTGIALAGFTSGSGSGYVFAQNGAGKELARMTTTADGTTGRISIDNSSGINLAGLTSSSLGAGYVFANAANGKTVGVITATSGSGGLIAANNPAATSVSYLTYNNANGGYVGAANSAGLDRVRITTNTAGSGIMSVSNANGNDVVEASVTTQNHGTVATYNANGQFMGGLLATTTGQGYITAYNSTGNERAHVSGGTNGGEIALRDNNGTQRALLNGSGYLEIDDVDGAAMATYFTGSGVGLISTDKLQHPRAEFKPGHINVNGTNGGENAFMGAVSGSPHLGYIGVCNANIVGAPVKAGMYTNASNQGIIFGDQKNFRIDYPGEPDKEIWYGSIEGPELAAYIRGTGKLINGKAILEFPDHYQKVANTATMTVIVTPLSGKSKGLAVVKKSTTGFNVEELLEGSGTYEFDWEVKCVRKGHEDFEPVRNKAEMEKFLNFPPHPTEVLQSRSRNELTVDPIVREKIIRQQ